ncbi:MAG: hypothetical protein QXR30_00885 [Candidatus Woesearchaeota archaeon]
MNTVENIDKTKAYLYVTYAFEIGKKFKIFEENAINDSIVKQIGDKYVESKLEEIISKNSEMSEPALIAKNSLESLIDTYHSMGEYILKNFNKSGAKDNSIRLIRGFGFLGAVTGLLLRLPYDNRTFGDVILTGITIVAGGLIGRAIGKGIALKKIAKGTNIGENKIVEYLDKIQNNIIEYSLTNDLNESNEIAKRIYEVNKEYKSLFSL